MRASGVLLFLGAAAAAMVAASLSVMTMANFQERWQHHTEKREQAAEYLRQPHCRKHSTTRRKLKGYDNCDESERIVASSPLWHALLDVSHDVPPLMKSGLDNIREDMLRIALTIAVLGFLYKLMRQYTGQTQTKDQYYGSTLPYQGLPMWVPPKPLVCGDY